MQDLLDDHFFLLFFLAMWFAVTTLLGFASGWFSNMREFPDRPETSFFKMSGQSAMMGLGVSMRGVITIEVCDGGLRFKMMRIFGPFSRAFFVPWDRLRVTRKNSMLFPAVVLVFGNNRKIRISSWAGDQLASAAKAKWPEKNPPPPMGLDKLKQHHFSRWLLMTAAAASFFIIVPMLEIPNKDQRPPILVAILFPAIVFGVGTIISYFREAKGSKN